MIGNGVVIAIGGNENKRRTQNSVLAEFVRLAGAADARIVVIPSASSEPARRARLYTRIFADLGAACVRTIHAERGVTPDDLMLIDNASGIFVTGGDQARLMEHLRRSGCAEVIVDAVRRGAVYAGTSAGASAVSRHMIVGRDVGDGREIVELQEGLGLVPAAIIDQHFGERGRLPRLLNLVREHGLRGVGIDEDTAVVWSGSELRVTGRGNVTLVHPATHEHLTLSHGETIAL